MTSTALIAQKLKRVRFNPPHGGPQEHLALISNGEANLLKRIGGAGQKTKFGVKSYENLYGLASPEQTRSYYSAPASSTSSKPQNSYSSYSGGYGNYGSYGAASGGGIGSGGGNMGYSSKNSGSDSASSRSSNGNNFSYSTPQRSGSYTQPTYSGPKGTNALNTNAYTVGNRMSPMVAGITSAAHELGVKPVDLATAISYETAGTFNPTIKGPVTKKYGQMRGLIQFGQPQADSYNVDWKNPIASQLGAGGAVAAYLKDAGVQPGMGLLPIYAAINAGGVDNINASDANNGGAPGTVADKVRYQMAGHQAKAERLLSSPYSPGYMDVASVPPIPASNSTKVAMGKKPDLAAYGLTAPVASDSETQLPVRIATHAPQPPLSNYDLTDYPVAAMQDEPAAASDTAGGLYGLGPRQTQNVAMNVAKRVPGVIGRAMVAAATPTTPSNDPNSYLITGINPSGGRAGSGFQTASTSYSNATSGIDPVLGMPWILDPVTGKRELRGSTRYDELLAAQNPITRGVQFA